MSDFESRIEVQDGKVVLACVGAGRWGRNLVRVFDSLPEAQLAAVCDANPDIRQTM